MMTRNHALNSKRFLEKFTLSQTDTPQKLFFTRYLLNQYAPPTRNNQPPHPAHEQQKNLTV
jgi:hypothetical protein